jgi:small-conductance mechanosensitive channel
MAAIDLSVVTSVGLVIVGGYAAILRYTLKREREVVEGKIISEAQASKDSYNATKARVDTVEADARKERERLQGELREAEKRINEAEKLAVKQQGEIALLRQAHDGITRDLEEIKRQQVPRAEWERQMRNVESTLATILERLDAPK